MNKNQENRLSMHKAIKKFFANNQKHIAGNADITMALGLLNSQITLTESLIRPYALKQITTDCTDDTDRNFLTSIPNLHLCISV